MGGEAQVTAGQEGVAGCESWTGEKAAGRKWPRRGLEKWE